MKAERGTRVTSDHVVIRDRDNMVTGRARVEVASSGTVYVYLTQTFGGSVEGTLDIPVKCDVEVLRSLVEEADRVVQEVSHDNPRS
jgi:hypothetical protein